MVVIRLARSGAKKRPFYHVVATDSRRRRDSNSIEALGYFNPIATAQETRLHLNLDRITYWRGVGAQFSDRMHALYKEFTKKSAEKAAPAPKAKKAAAKKPKKNDAE